MSLEPPPTTDDPAINFTSTTGGNLVIPVGLGDSVTLNFAGPLLRARGLVTLAISEFVYLSGNFSFEKGPALPTARLPGRMPTP